MAETALTFDDRATGRRGVLASYADVTPVKQDDVSRFRISLRDALWLLSGCVAMVGAQVVATSGLRSDIRDLATKFQSYQLTQQNTNNEMQRQIDDARRNANLAVINDAQTAKELAELKGFLAGSGMKGVIK